MLEHPILKAAGAVGTAVGLLTGIGTLIGWAATDSFQESAYVAVQWAGVSYILLAELAICIPWFRRHLFQRHLTRSTFASRRNTIPLIGLGIAICLAIIVVLSAFIRFITTLGGIAVFVIGCIAILTGIWFSVLWAIGQARAYRNSRRECLDCAETIKRKARVCPHCGYRFKSPPTLDEQQVVKSN